MQRRPSSGKRTSRPIAAVALKPGRPEHAWGATRPTAAQAPSQRPRRKKKK